MTYCLRALHSDRFVFLSQFCALTGLSWLVPLPVWPGGLSGGFSQGSRAWSHQEARLGCWNILFPLAISVLSTDLSFPHVFPLMVSQGLLEPDFHGRRSRSCRPFKGRTWNHTASLPAHSVYPSSSGTDQRECGRGLHRARYRQSPKAVCPRGDPPGLASWCH